MGLLLDVSLFKVKTAYCFSQFGWIKNCFENFVASMFGWETLERDSQICILFPRWGLVCGINELPNRAIQDKPETSDSSWMEHADSRSRAWRDSSSTVYKASNFLWIPSGLLEEIRFLVWTRPPFFNNLDSIHSWSGQDPILQQERNLMQQRWSISRHRQSCLVSHWA